MMGLHRQARTRPLVAILVFSVLMSTGLFSLHSSVAPIPVEAAGASASLAAAAPDPEPGPYAVGVTRRTFTRTSDTDGTPRTLATVIWYPADPSAASLGVDPLLNAAVDAQPATAAAPYPVVLYSHGSNAQPWSSTFFTTHLASFGFVVVAPSHPGNTTDTCPAPCVPTNPAERAAELDSLTNRPGDMSDTLTQALALSSGSDALLAGLLDGNRVGLTGKSYGGNTVFRTLPRDPRFLAGVAMAPEIGPSATSAAASIAVPMMVIAGMLDDQVPFAGQQALFGALPAHVAPDWMIVFPHAGHDASADVCRASFAGCKSTDLPPAQAHLLIDHWATAFLLRYVAGDQTQSASLDPSAAQGNPEIIVTSNP